MAALGAPFCQPSGATATTTSSPDFRRPRLPGGFSKHLREHGKRQCPKCIWARRRASWLRASRIDHPILSRKNTSWIEVRPVHAGRWRLGCWVCRQSTHNTQGPGEFGNFEVRSPQKCNIVRHGSSGRHKRSVRQLLHHLGLIVDKYGGTAAPSVEAFTRLLQRIRRNELEGYDQRRTAVTMSRCL